MSDGGGEGAASLLALLCTLTNKYAASARNGLDMRPLKRVPPPPLLIDALQLVEQRADAPVP